MSFEVTKWDGWGKLGRFKVGEKVMQTPALFPVVHPTFQNISPPRLKNEFGYSQFITSTYLLSKKYSLEEAPKIHEHLNTDSIVMMDSGAYQLMVYGDVELSPSKTMEYQKSVGADIGVIMDHPIGYDIRKDEAKERVETTISRVKESITYMKKGDPVWTLPIQGGKFTELIDYYLDHVLEEQILNKYGFFALGSVVQVMIKQDYLSMVKMIMTARKRIPVSYPLHLFGAGHPAMFALATYLGCDTFDSAAYSLMAKDGRYMTNFGTYSVQDLVELPCVCPVCSTITVERLKSLPKDERSLRIAEHNLWVSAMEIKAIRTAIQRGELRDLVLARANSVPGLAKATRYALSHSDYFTKGTPISSPNAIRIAWPLDLHRPEILNARKRLHRYLERQKQDHTILVGLDWTRSTFRKLPDEQLKKFPLEILDKVYLLSPLFGIIPRGMDELFPLTQFTDDLTLSEHDPEVVMEGIQLLESNGLEELTLILHPMWKMSFLEGISKKLKVNVITDKRPMAVLKKVLQEL